MQFYILISTVLVMILIPLLEAKQPHILLIVADDYGFHDIGYHGSQIKTPALDKLAGEGVKLESYYVQPICTPSRSQLMSGKYQIHTGLSHGYIMAQQPNGLPLEDKTIADQLRAVGYSTHMVGKWHLGFYKKEYTPVHRGFDSFFGYLTGSEDYYTHQRCAEFRGNSSQQCGVDLHIDEETVWNNTEYSTQLFARRAIDLVRNHDAEKPLFLYLPFQAVHGPLQVPQRYQDMYSHIKDRNRRVYAGMVTCMDDAVHNITQAFKDAGMWEDTLLVFSTDNGGEIHQGGNNYPLRGWKHSLWDGGMHGVGFVHSTALQKQGYINEELMHISDWYPTLLHVAGSNASTEGLDGHNQWETLSQNAPSPRKELLHNIDILFTKKGENLYPGGWDTRTRAALRMGDWKILTGDPGNSSWIPPPEATTLYFNPTSHDDDPSAATQNLWLFNIRDDPNERVELSKQYPGQVKLMLERLLQYNATAVPPRFPAIDENANPQKHGGQWVPWLDAS